MKRQEVIGLLTIAAISVVAGRWAKGKKFDYKTLVGFVLVLFFLLALNMTAPQVATPFAVLVVVLAAFEYWPDIFFKLGLNPKQELHPK